jgi:hypothetical protein
MKYCSSDLISSSNCRRARTAHVGVLRSRLLASRSNIPACTGLILSCAAFIFFSKTSCCSNYMNLSSGARAASQWLRKRKFFVVNILRLLSLQSLHRLVLALG